MAKQTVITRKRRRPAPTGKGTLVGVRLQPSQLAAVDDWIEKQDAPMTRPEGYGPFWQLPFRNATHGFKESQTIGATDPNETYQVGAGFDRPPMACRRCHRYDPNSQRPVSSLIH